MPIGIDRLFFSNRPATTLAGLQRDVYEYTQRVKDYLNQAHLFSKILEGVTVRTTETVIPHNLGVVPIGWRVLSPSSPNSVYQTRAPDTKNLYLANGQAHSGEDWPTAERRRLLGLAGLSEARAGVVWDGFHAPGKAGSGGDFGERWDALRVNHQTAGGAVWRNGVCVIEQAGGIWTDNYIVWKGPGIVQDDAGERAAMAVRFKGHVRPATNANNILVFGLVDLPIPATTKSVNFGADEATDTTFCVFGVSGMTPIVTTVTIASLYTQEHLLEIVRKPVGGAKTLIAYFDGVEVARIVPTVTLTNLKPHLYMNTGTVVIDDMMVVTDAAFTAPSSSPLSDGSVVISLEVL